MLVQPRRGRAMELLRETGLISVVLPEVAGLKRRSITGSGSASPGGSTVTCWQRTLAVLDRLDRPSFPLALAALLHATGWQAEEAIGGESPGAGARRGAEIVERVAERWKLSNKDTERAAWLVEHHRALVEAAAMPWPRLQRLLISPGIDELLALHEAIAQAAGHEVRHIAYCRQKLALPEAELNPTPLLTGDDLKRHGIPPGKAYKTLLEKVRDAQLEGRVNDLAGALVLVDRLLT